MQEQSVTLAQPQRVSTSSSNWVRIVIGAVAMAALFFLGRQLGAYVPQFADWVQGLGVWGPLVFMLGYIVATVALIPGSVLTLSAGAIFGLGAGLAYVFIAASLGAIAAFLVSRYLARATVEAKLAGNERFAAIDRAVAGQGLKIVTLLRLSPVFPFNLLNYGLGLTQVRLRDYALACFGMLPGSMLYVYYGKLAGDVAALAGGAAPERGLGYYAVLGVGFLATLLVTVVVTRVARRALGELANA